jgi:hypothetical protein
MDLEQQRKVAACCKSGVVGLDILRCRLRDAPLGKMVGSMNNLLMMPATKFMKLSNVVPENVRSLLRRTNI